MFNVISPDARGSSPLTRGTQSLTKSRISSIRFIPAYAGNSRLWLSVVLSLSVHPRLRGELGVNQKLRRHNIGSSPLTRGTHESLLYERNYFRFIPAYAGNSLKDGINPSIHTLGI